eukprot:7159871-Prymnesium_polylepis.2
MNGTLPARKQEEASRVARHCDELTARPILALRRSVSFHSPLRCSLYEATLSSRASERVSSWRARCARTIASSASSSVSEQPSLSGAHSPPQGPSQ